jgi:hypothetical protein
MYVNVRLSAVENYKVVSTQIGFDFAQPDKTYVYTFEITEIKKTVKIA